MTRPPKKTCANCRDLKALVKELCAEVATLRQQVASLREQLAAAQKNSSTSSKPPSSDIVKPKPIPPDDSGKRSIGGQPGHPKHERVPFSAEQVTCFKTHVLDSCPCCCGPVRPNGAKAKVVQQVDVSRPPQTVEQHTTPEFWCDQCRRGFMAALPSHIERGQLAGPQLTALIAFMKGACHASFATIRTFLRDVVGVTISRGQLSKILGKVSAALAKPYEELEALLPGEATLNVDETGHHENGALMWTWCFRAELYTLYHIDPHRSADVLMDKLGTEFAGVLGCDYFSAYRRYLKECGAGGVTLQFCLAHLIRDVKFLTTLPDRRDRQYGEDLRVALQQLFAIYHRRDEYSKRDFRTLLSIARYNVLQVGLSGPDTQRGRNMTKRFREHGEAYFTFITESGVEPTNNLAEQAIRFVVIDRHITQGTRSEAGRRFCERMWTTIATCVQQGRSVWRYLCEAVGNWFEGQPAPSLLSASN
jgi:transposase